MDELCERNFEGGGGCVHFDKSRSDDGVLLAQPRAQGRDDGGGNIVARDGECVGDERGELVPRRRDNGQNRRECAVGGGVRGSGGMTHMRHSLRFAAAEKTSWAARAARASRAIFGTGSNARSKKRGMTDSCAKINVCSARMAASRRSEGREVAAATAAAAARTSSEEAPMRGRAASAARARSFGWSGDLRAEVIKAVRRSTIEERGAEVERMSAAMRR